jgi:ectoine hydroxylase-related dioxygenase (phytanoyl-CoA dioxygenase family)
MTDAQRLSYEANGFLTIPNALSSEELARVRAAADSAEAIWRADPTRLGGRGALLDQVQAPIEYDPALRDLLWHPSVFPLVRAILGEDVMMIDNDYFITPPHTPQTHAGWHHDVGMRGVYHPKSTLMVKVFFLLTDVDEASGGTAMIPGSHKFDLKWTFPVVEDPKTMPGAVQMTGAAGTAYLYTGRVYHCAVRNESDRARRVLIYNYGHFWMKMWAGYEPSAELLAWAHEHGDPVARQLLGIGDAYGQSLS